MCKFTIDCSDCTELALIADYDDCPDYTDIALIADYFDCSDCTDLALIADYTDFMSIALCILPVADKCRTHFYLRTYH